MRLLDQEPKWLEKDGQRVGLVFRSPADRTYWQSCFFQPTRFKDQCELFVAAIPDEENRGMVQPCRSDFGWRVVAGSDFADLSIEPSLDGSAGGLWHGFITKGELTNT